MQIPETELKPWAVQSQEYLYRDRWFNARKDRCEKPDGSIVDPYYVLEYDEWVTAVALTAENEVLVVRQYRHALGEVGLELPGGCVDKTDASLEDAVRRELLEETGYSFATMHYLGRTSPNPSTNANLMHMFVGTGGVKIQEQMLDEHEEIEVLRLPLETVVQLMQEKRIVQSMHITTLFYALQYLGLLTIKL